MVWLEKPPGLAAIHALDEIDSTNVYAKTLASQGASHLTLVVAKRQSAGKGRSGRQWISGEGNVFWSLLMRREADWPAIGTLPFVAALSVFKTLGQVTNAPARFSIKWPNDTLLDGKKISGILLEGVGSEWVVAGIGINVAHFPQDNPLYPATSLMASGYPGIARDGVIAALTETFLATLKIWRDGGYPAIRDEVTAAMTGIGQPITVRRNDKPEDNRSGIFRGLDDEGRLILRTADGSEQLVVVGDVFLQSS